MARAMKDSGIEWIGEIPTEWSHGKAKYYIIISNGSDPKTEGETPVYGSGAGSFRTCGEHKTGPCVLLGRKGATLHIPHYIDHDYWNVDTAFDVKTKSNYDLRFYFYLACCFDYKQYISQTTLPGMTQTSYENMYIPIPGYQEQKLIASWLDEECSRVDSVIDQTWASIEEYKKLKQAVITQAVTKGIRPDRQMKDSGVDWLGEVPENWNVLRIANLYNERNEGGSDDLPILTVSINTGISDHEIPDEEKARVVVRSEDKSKYKRVYPGDLAYNMMRAWQGAFGAVRTDGMISPAYVVAKPKKNIELDSRYIEALLRTPSAIEEMHRYSHGITDFRLRLYWPEFKNIRVCVPPIEEQQEIADFIDIKTSQIDELIAKKEKAIEEINTYKKSLIYEYVTGKKEVM